MDFDSNNTVPTAYAQVVTPTVAQMLVMPTVMPISIPHGEKSEKFNGLSFKMW